MSNITYLFSSLDLFTPNITPTATAPAIKAAIPTAAMAPMMSALLFPAGTGL